MQSVSDDRCMDKLVFLLLFFLLFNGSLWVVMIIIDIGKIISYFCRLVLIMKNGCHQIDFIPV